MAVITENTINSYLSQLFKEYGFKQLPQMDISGRKQPDHLLEYKGLKIISETEVGDFKKELAEALCQLTKYNSELRWDNLLAIIFPDSVRKPIPIESSREAINDILKQTKIKAYYTLKGKSTAIFDKGTVFDFLSELRKIVESTFEKPEIDFDSLVKVLRDLTEEFSFVMRSLQIGDQVYRTPVGSFELFTAIAEKDENTLQTSAVDLVAYIFINQLLFYKIFADKHSQLPKLRPIEELSELKIRYEKILDIDFKAIYAIDIISILPENKLIINEINKIINVINNLPFEDVEHDILGRFFHDLLPFDTRKLLAAFYTRPQSAEILSTLAIDNADEKVIDPACGSGTLLVSAYRRKARLARKFTKKMHRKFIEEDIFGIDIMPFAIHLTALNLTMQNIEATTNYTQTAIGDSLLELPVGSVRKALEAFPGFLDTMTYRSLNVVEGDKKISIPSKFFDVVIMNPPFTKTERLPKSYSKQIKENWQDWGGGVGLWGSFIGLACDYLVKPEGGKIAAVIPIAIFRGKETERLREKLFSEKSVFRVKYVVKAIKNLAFSESSAFRDILIVFESGNDSISMTAFVFLKSDLKDLTVKQARQIGEKIRSVEPGQDYEDDQISVYWVSWKKLVQSRRNLMPYVNIVKHENRHVLFKFFEILQSHPQFDLPSKRIAREGIAQRPKGKSKILLITRPTHSSRIKQAFMILKEDSKDKPYIVVTLKGLNWDFKIPRRLIVPTLRTAAGIKKMNINKDEFDYMIIQPFEGFEMVKQIAEVDWNMDWEKLRKELEASKTQSALVRRIRYNSNNFSVLSINSKHIWYPTNRFRPLVDKYNIIYVLYLNSIAAISQIYTLKEDTTENYADIQEHDISCAYLPVIDRLTDSQISQLNDLWERLKDKEFPSLLEQFNTTNPLRLTLDRTIFEIFGIKFDVKKLYRAIAEEIERNVGVK